MAPDIQQAWHGSFGNINGTGDMLGPLVPDPASGTDVCDIAGLYHVSAAWPRATPKRAKHVAEATSTQLQQACLDVFVFDRLTGDPVVGATVIVADSSSTGKVTNAGSTSTHSTKTNTRGRVLCKILAHRK